MLQQRLRILLSALAILLVLGALGGSAAVQAQGALDDEVGEIDLLDADNNVAGQVEVTRTQRGRVFVEIESDTFDPNQNRIAITDAGICDAPDFAQVGNEITNLSNLQWMDDDDVLGADDDDALGEEDDDLLGADDDDAEEADEVEGAFLQNEAQITEAEARAVVEAEYPDANVIEIELEREAGETLVYSVELDTGLEVEVNADTGEILGTEQDDDALGEDDDDDLGEDDDALGEDDDDLLGQDDADIGEGNEFFAVIPSADAADIFDADGSALVVYDSTSPRSDIVACAVIGDGQGQAAANVTPLADLVADPTAFDGESVVLEDTVGARMMLGGNLLGFTLGNERVVVLSTDPSGFNAADVARGSTVRVPGTIETFDITALEEEFGVNLNDQVLAPFEGLPIVRATPADLEVVE